jgi:RNA ligase
MLKELITKYGKQKINTLTKYPSILTLHRLGEKGKLTEDLTTDFANEEMFATEKIDGTNVRIICLGDEYLIGSREFILHYKYDLYFDPAVRIVEGLREIEVKIPNDLPTLTVIYGELFGGKITANSKNYGVDKIGFRAFDVVVFDDLSILDQSVEEIARWRERETEQGIIYGQNFLQKTALEQQLQSFGIEIAPLIPFELGDKSHKTILENLEKSIATTNVALSEAAQMRAEGLILRNADRSKIVKIRFEDYQRTLRK